MLRKLTKIVTICLLVSCLLLEISVLRHKPEIYAEYTYPCAGIVEVQTLRMREEPNTQGAAVQIMYEGNKLTVLGETTGEEVEGSTLWYEVRYGNREGYVSSQYVSLEAQDPIDLWTEYLPEDQDFEAAMSREGFPESYKEKLRTLHQKFPKWEFKALHTNYSFEYAVAGEMGPAGLSMIPASCPDSYKSDYPRDYDPETGTWVFYEPGWVGASEYIVAFQMDPRNFLDEEHIFQFENLQYNPSCHTEEGVSAMIQNTFMSSPDPVEYINPLGERDRLDRNYVEVFLNAAKYSGVSPYHLASRAIQEVGAAGSDSVSGDYRGIVGYYNFFNIGAYATARDSDPVYNGLLAAMEGFDGQSQEARERMYFPWSDPERSIMGGAYFLGKDYINADQQTLYLQKFNLSSRYFPAFSHQYMGNVLAPMYEARSVYKAYAGAGALATPKEFLIPVFTDMGATAPAPMEQSKSGNNYLKSLEINNQPLMGFTATKNQYEFTTGGNVQYISVTAVAAEQGATIEGTGVYALRSDLNVIEVSVKAPNGRKRVYSIELKNGQKAMTERDFDIQSKTLLFDDFGYMFGADPCHKQNTLTYFRSQIEIPQEIELSLEDPSGKALQDEDAAGTGAQLIFRRNGKEAARMTLVIYGDVNGDGVIDLTDANAIMYHALGRDKLSAAANLAIDVNGDGSSDIIDANTIAAYVQGKKEIEQKR